MFNKNREGQNFFLIGFVPTFAMKLSIRFRFKNRAGTRIFFQHNNRRQLRLAFLSFKDVIENMILDHRVKS